MSDETAVPGQLDGELITDAPPGYRLLQLLWDDEIGTSNAASSTAGGPQLGLRLLRARVTGRPERRRLRDAFLAVTAVTPHRGVLTVHEAGFTAGGRPDLVTDLPRDTMERRLAAAGPLSVPAAAAVGHLLAGALDAAHARGVLHQDVRPGTVVWSAEETPLLADFGVAAALISAGAADLPPYALVHAAREVFGWETAGPAADVHGLASTIYTMLAGQPPYHAEALLGRAALYQRVLRGAPPPVPGVPARLSALLADMMAPDPASRPALPEVMGSLAELAGLARWPRPGPIRRRHIYPGPIRHSRSRHSNIRHRRSRSGRTRLAARRTRPPAHLTPRRRLPGAPAHHTRPWRCCWPSAWSGCWPAWCGAR